MQKLFCLSILVLLVSACAHQNYVLKENFQASFGNRLVSCEPLGLFHINVGIIVMPGNLSSLVESSRQQHVPLSSIFRPLKGLSPYLLTRDQKFVHHRLPSA